MTSILTFDVETHGAESIWDMAPEEFVRLIGYSWDGGDVTLTTDIEELKAAIRRAKLIIGHNIHAYDLTAVFGKDSIEPLELARAGRIFDTWTHATLAHPAPFMYTDRAGRRRLSVKPEQAKGWFSLDNQAYQLDVPGKYLDLKKLAKEYGGFGEIPLDDEEFREYLRQDVRTTWNVALGLLRLMPLNGYAKREQINAAIDAQNARNGWRIDVAAATARVEAIQATNQRYLAMLSKKFGLPTEGKAPLRTKAGREAVLVALGAADVDPESLPKTKAGQVSLGVLGDVEAPNERARELLDAIAGIGGLRPLAQSALDNVQADGRVHPQISTLQRSGRKSTTNPGLTIWTTKGDGAVEKSYFIPNNDDEVLVEFDYSQADARIVAAYSGDRQFAQRFTEGADAHMMTAEAVWGPEVVAEDPEKYRDIAKKLGHAYAYRAGPRKLAVTAKQPFAVAKRFVEAMQAEYPVVAKWQNRVTMEGRQGFVTNAWGRNMVVDRGREWTQAPALYGQSGTREIVVDGLIRLPNEILRMLVAQVHDALVFSIPKLRADEISAKIEQAMTTDWAPPKGGQSIHFPVTKGPHASTWQEAGHREPR